MANKEAKTEKENKNKKSFFKDFKAELKKVIWPTPKQVLNNTIAVITIVLITAAIVFVLDLCFDLINEYGINRLKSNIKNKVVVENVVDETADNNENSVENTNNAEEQSNTAQNESSQENVQ